ncbi:hypothetical protein ACFOZ0_06420 [Streptomyces yaanensis]|uniref:Uncharacterized protein n=1 Tax=Streptomyces yaanensis TaxID=1142239 RepID=A0ABV7S9G2_9ACTN|nr:hypothetical protein [Streptomyces sp. CGMCC 4.7035]WNC02435.1 hypothetical protein Q2K21_32680 [Streptomyces sp. CGMCC 4.7035]
MFSHTYGWLWAAFLHSDQPPKFRSEHPRSDRPHYEEGDPNTVDLDTLMLTIIGIIGLLVLVVMVFTDAAIKILGELQKLREAWRRFREEGDEDDEVSEEESRR